MPYRITPKIIILFLLFFIITYFEDRYIGGISFAAIWKMPFVLYLVYYTYFRHIKESSRFLFVAIAGIFSLKFLIHTNSLNSIFPEINTDLKYIILPTLFFFMYREFRFQPQKVIKFLFWLSVFLIWCNVPYLLNVFQPKVQKDMTLVFGNDMMADAGFSGAFMTIHSQSIYMASACMFILFLIYRFPRKFSLRSPFLIMTLSIGMYCLFLSFARTGWALFSIGILSFLIRELKGSQIWRIVLLILILVISGAYLFQNSESFRMRLLDEQKFSTRNRIDEVGSGRLIFASTALANWWNSGFYSIMIGYGAEVGKEKMQKKTGMKIFAHNEYIEILQDSGLIGFILFIVFLYSLFIFIRKKRNIFSNLSFGFFVGWMVVGSVQTFSSVYLNVIMAGVIVLSVSSKNFKRRGFLKDMLAGKVSGIKAEPA